MSTLTAISVIYYGVLESLCCFAWDKLQRFKTFSAKGKRGRWFWVRCVPNNQAEEQTAKRGAVLPQFTHNPLWHNQTVWGLPGIRYREFVWLVPDLSDASATWVWDSKKGGNGLPAPANRIPRKLRLPVLFSQLPLWYPASHSICSPHKTLDTHVRWKRTGYEYIRRYAVRIQIRTQTVVRKLASRRAKMPSNSPITQRGRWSGITLW